MIAELLNLPAGAPASLAYLVAALVVVALQVFPIPGIFLMIVGGPLWAGVLITIAMVGTVWEVATGQVSPVWLVLPGLYFGLYHCAVGWERIAAARITAAIADFNAGKQLAFDPARQDLLLVKGKGDWHIGSSALLLDYALPRVFEGGRVTFIGTPEACKLASSEAARESGLSSFFNSFGKRANVPEAMREGGIISAPGEPERPVLSVTSDSTNRWERLVPLVVSDFTLLDAESGANCQLRTARASLLATFPFPIIGFALNSGAPKWQGFAGWKRQRARPLAAGAIDGREMIADALGLAPSVDLAARAVGAEAVAAMIAQSDVELTDKELAILEAMLADPLTHIKNGWFRHLIVRPEVVAPFSDRIIAALGLLQTTDLRGSETGRNLWRLLAALPDEVLALYRARIVAWLDPAAARPWTAATDEIYARLDAAVPQERAILLHRLETQRGDLQTWLLPGFAKMGSAAPAEVKARLLALWRARAPDPAKKGSKRGSDDTVLYFTLARMGLKAEAGEVVQHYYGPTYAAIWREVEADSHEALCDASSNELSNHFKRLERARPA
jgi:hypothetical protein